MYKKISPYKVEISYHLTMLVILLLLKKKTNQQQTNHNLFFTGKKPEVVYNRTIAFRLCLKTLKNVLSGVVKFLLLYIQQSPQHNRTRTLRRLQHCSLSCHTAASGSACAPGPSWPRSGHEARSIVMENKCLPLITWPSCKYQRRA